MTGNNPAKIRAFIAIHPDAEIIAKLEKLQEDLRKRMRTNEVRWARTNQLHLTLQFLAHIETNRLSEFEAVLAQVCSGHTSFQLLCRGVGCFPTEKRPRIFWAGLEGELEPLRRLKEALDRFLAPLGFVPEGRIFHPHITLARLGHLKLKEIELISQQVVSSESVTFGGWKVEKVDLMQSILSPAGAEYRLLRSFPLVDPNM